MPEAGMALDYLGREIVVREPSVKRLSVIKGFENIQGRPGTPGLAFGW